MTRPKTHPEHERMAIAAEVVQLLSQVDELGHRRWTTVSLGQALGGLRHETIRLARSSAGVGPAVHDAILRLTGLTMGQLLQKHRIEPGVANRGRAQTLSASKASRRATIQPSSAGDAGAGAVPDGVELGKQVTSALEADGFARRDAVRAVGEILCGGEIKDILELYPQRPCDPGREKKQSLKVAEVHAADSRAGSSPLVGAHRAKPSAQESTWTICARSQPERSMST